MTESDPERPTPFPPELPQTEAARVSKVRWWIHLLIIGSYPLAIGALSGIAVESTSEPVAALSADPVQLLQIIGSQLIIFFALFGLACLISRATREQLLLSWNQGWAPVWRGFLYSIALRLGIGAIALAAMVVAMLFGGFDEQTLEEIRPKIEHSVDTEAMEHSPLYLFLNVTLVSFVFAGFREELWRVGVLVGMEALFPRLFESFRGKVVAISIVAIIFGLGHLSQGWGGVAITTALGIGLGAILVFHRSLWDAVLAHGFFNASSFIMIYLLLHYFPEYNPF